MSTTFQTSPDATGDLWGPVRTLVGSVLFFLALATLALPTILDIALLAHYQGFISRPPSWLSTSLYFMSTKDNGVLSPIVDYWPAIPGLGAGLALAYPQHRKQIIFAIALVMIVVGFLSSGAYFFSEQHLIEPSRRAAFATYAFPDLDTNRADLALTRFHNILERSRDVSIAFIAALVGGGIGAATQKRSQ